MARILIIDDDPAIVLLLNRIIERMGHEVHSAREGGSGLASAAAGQFDIILADLHMPGTPSGMDLIEEIHERCPGSRIVITSGSPIEEFQPESEKLGIRDYLHKPFDMLQVRELITRVTAT